MCHWYILIKVFVLQASPTSLFLYSISVKTIIIKNSQRMSRSLNFTKQLLQTVDHTLYAFG